MVTREEKHSTRGRARTSVGDAERERARRLWRADEVYEALDLCLSCKGCTNDCPVNVDMPTLKAEFLSHHYKRRLRPRHAYAFGLIDQARAARVARARLVERVTQTPASRGFKLAGGMTPEREIPAFAPLTLQHWFARRGRREPGSGGRSSSGPTRSTTTSTRRSASPRSRRSRTPATTSSSPKATSAAGGRSTTTASSTWPSATSGAASTSCASEYREGIPIVGLEPSCVAVFKDELGKLLPHDDDAKRLAQSTFHFAEFFERFDVEPPRLERKALVYGHCHHKATGGIDPEVELLEKMGVEVETLEGRLLRARRLVGLRGRPLRRLDALRRAGAPARGARARRRRRWSSPTASPARRRSSRGARGGGRSTSRRC